MGDIYRDSTITIAAMASAGGKHSILSRNNKLEVQPTTTNLKMADTGDVVVTVALAEFCKGMSDRLIPLGAFGINRLNHARTSSPASSAFCGQSQVFWHCRAGFEAAEGAADVDHIPESYLPTSRLSTTLQS